jgi:hypothetical protein
MFKPTASFKLSKSSKRMMIATSDKARATAFKKLMIDAELTKAHQPKRERVKRDTSGE